MAPAAVPSAPGGHTSVPPTFAASRTGSRNSPWSTWRRWRNTDPSAAGRTPTPAPRSSGSPRGSSRSSPKTTRWALRWGGPDRPPQDPDRRGGSPCFADGRQPAREPRGLRRWLDRRRCRPGDVRGVRRALRAGVPPTGNQDRNPAGAPDGPGKCRHGRAIPIIPALPRVGPMRLLATPPACRCPATPPQEPGGGGMSIGGSEGPE